MDYEQITRDLATINDQLLQRTQKLEQELLRVTIVLELLREKQYELIAQYVALCSNMDNLEDRLEDVENITRDLEKGVI